MNTESFGKQKGPQFNDMVFRCGIKEVAARKERIFKRNRNRTFTQCFTKTAFWSVVALVGMLCLVWSAPSVSAASDATKQVQQSIDSILQVLKDKELQSPDKKDKRRKAMSALIQERFDFEEMAKRSLARHWRDRKPQEKKKFVAIFTELLEASYMEKIEGYTDEKILYDKERVKGKYGAVYTTIKTKTAEIPIIYKVKLRGEKWWVYDVDIEGISMINTYRQQFNQIIVSKSYEDLVSRLEKKLQENKSQEKK